MHQCVFWDGSFESSAAACAGLHCTWSREEAILSSFHFSATDAFRKNKVPFATPLPSTVQMSGGVHETQNRKKVFPCEPVYCWYTHTVYCAVVKMLLLMTILCDDAAETPDSPNRTLMMKER